MNAAWNHAFGNAQYVILTASNHRRVPWTPQLEAYLASHFRQIYQAPHKLTVYARTGLRSG